MEFDKTVELKIPHYLKRASDLGHEIDFLSGMTISGDISGIANQMALDEKKKLEEKAQSIAKRQRMKEYEVKLRKRNSSRRKTIRKTSSSVNALRHSKQSSQSQSAVITRPTMLSNDPRIDYFLKEKYKAQERWSKVRHHFGFADIKNNQNEKKDLSEVERLTYQLEQIQARHWHFIMRGDPNHRRQFEDELEWLKDQIQSNAYETSRKYWNGKINSLENLIAEKHTEIEQLNNQVEFLQSECKQNEDFHSGMSRDKINKRLNSLTSKLLKLCSEKSKNNKETTIDKVLNVNCINDALADLESAIQKVSTTMKEIKSIKYTKASTVDQDVKPVRMRKKTSRSKRIQDGENKKRKGSYGKQTTKNRALAATIREPSDSTAKSAQFSNTKTFTKTLTYKEMDTSNVATGMTPIATFDGKMSRIEQMELQRKHADDKTKEKLMNEYQHDEQEVFKRKKQIQQLNSRIAALQKAVRISQIDLNDINM